MCLGVPGRVTEVDEMTAVVDFWGVKRRVRLDICDEPVQPGDYVLNHVPRELLPALFERVHTWLRPGGLFLATLGASDLESWQGEWLGVRMYFSGFDPSRNRELLSSFELVADEVVTIAEPEGDVSFHWVLAQK